MYVLLKSWLASFPIQGHLCPDKKGSTVLERKVE
jgi:hypothetical protein